MTDLRTVLNSKNLNQLKFTCDILNISLPISSRKADVVALVYETLNNKEILDLVYSILSDEEIENFKLATTNDKNDNLYDEKKLLFLHMIGYINIKDKLLISNVIFDSINSPSRKLEAKRKRNDLINKYFTCFANLYGVVPVDKLAKIFNRYENEKLKENELEDIRYMTYIKVLPYVVDNEYLINREIFSFEECIDYLFEITDNQEGKRCAILPKEELMKYIDLDYFEKTPQYRRMQTMLSFELGLSKKDAEELADEFAYMCKADVDFDFVFRYLEDKNIVFKDMAQCNRFIGAYADMQNNTRLWENCGNTPVEISKQMR